MEEDKEDTKWASIFLLSETKPTQKMQKLLEMYEIADVVIILTIIIYFVCVCVEIS